MFNNISIKQGHSIYIYEEEIEFILKVLESKGIGIECLDISQNILNLNKSYVGYIKTNKRIIELTPKHESITLNHIIRMYYFVYGNFKNFEDPIFDLNSSDNYINIVDMFINELKIIKRKGLSTEYISKKEYSNYIRGSVDYVNSYKNIIALKNNPFENYIDELTVDNILNRTLKKAFEKVCNIKFDFEDLRSIKSMFNNVNNLESKNKDVHFSSKNYYCKNAYFLANLILEESYFDSSGDIGGESFLINYDLLFEKFIKEILFKVSKDTRFIEWNAKQVYGQWDKNDKLYIPDILFNYSSISNECTGIIDVKNKLDGNFKNADIFQMLFYSGMLNCKKAILCYPSNRDEKNKVLEMYSDSFITNKIYSVYIDISVESKDDFKKEIFTLIDKIYCCIEAN
ncbi:McrC family protein [Terrisporobacter petrolearius]|uniref:5-methylcytosine restriction system specificity protein McrC n=1 Tax=Terrisporobacter petrolearius TaxID=1460447 RepID=UPI0008DFF4E0|nr:hypothetical protein [Terrisporobacter petrolearius]MCC3865930.1 McrC family protein [Terrisporobacter petrolearius]SFJ51860.1 5-methylcytosine-specific restriction enzyme subunit McrC [Terrisporobacter glycolicus]